MAYQILLLTHLENNIRAVQHLLNITEYIRSFIEKNEVLGANVILSEWNNLVFTLS